MRAVFILIIMFFAHSFADYHLQGILAELKQKDKWPHDNGLYRVDYKVALATHAFEWSFVVMLPCLMSIFHACTDLSWPNIELGAQFILLLYINATVHYFVDDLKANDKKINLAQDQVFHIIQIIFTWMFWTANVGW